MDQSLSVRNLKSIYNVDIEKGGALERVYVPDAHMLRKRKYRLRNIRRKLYSLMKKGVISSDRYESRNSLVCSELLKTKESYDSCVDSYFSKLVGSVNKKGFDVSISKVLNKISDKDVYSVGDDSGSVFVSKYLQRVLKFICSVKPENRDIVISRFKTICGDGSPKFIIRADIESFFESIDHGKLMSIIGGTPEISVQPKRLLTSFLRRFADLSGMKKGVPRGIGISAYLSEIFMKELDDEIRSSREVIFYARYVDDIIIVYAPKSNNSTESYLCNLKRIVECRGLRLNSKTVEVDLVNKSNGTVEYLGYKFAVKSERVNVSLSQNKKRKYHRRIDLAIDNYKKLCVTCPDKAFKILIKRVRFLTGNTRLLDRKKNAFVGVYFSNKFITDTADLSGLDLYMKNKIKKTISDARLVRRLSKYSFTDGFNKKVFRNFSINELSDMSKVWNNV